MEMEGFRITGRVEALFVTTDTQPSETLPQRILEVYAPHGIYADRHLRSTRAVDSREQVLRSFGFPKGATIANHRQFTATSVEELAEISSALELPTPIPPGTLGENLVISGIPRLTHLPAGTLLLFKSGSNELKLRAVLAVWQENLPCSWPGERLQKLYPDVPNLKGRFVQAAMGRRGIVGTVYASGTIYPGEVIAAIPKQRLYEGV